MQVYVKPNCEKSLEALNMVTEYGGIDQIFVVGQIDEEQKDIFENELEAYEADEIMFISEKEFREEFKEESLPLVLFDSFDVGYEKLLEAYESEELYQYFT